MSLIIPVVLLGVLASLSPTTMIVFILLLATARARVNAVAFLFGWGLSLTIVFAAGYAIGGARLTQRSDGRTAVDLIEILLGVALTLAAAQRWQRRHLPRPTSGVSRTLATRLRRLRPWEAAVLGVLKEPWTLTAAAAVVVVHHHTAAVVALFAFLLFTVVSTATVGLTFWYYARYPADAEGRLSAIKDWLVQAGPVLFTAVSVVVGLYFIIDGTAGLLQT